MLFDHIEEKEAVKTAALIEQNGYDFYTFLAERTTVGEARALFEKFAADELGHLKLIEKEFFPKAGFTDQITEEELAIEEYLGKTGAADIFTKRINVEALVKAIDNHKKALLIALDTERHSVEYFGELSRRCSTPEGRRIYEDLMEEEKTHVRLIEEQLEREPRP
jgi:rubrerythrin